MSQGPASESQPPPPVSSGMGPFAGAARGLFRHHRSLSPTPAPTARRPRPASTSILLPNMRSRYRYRSGGTDMPGSPPQEPVRGHSQPAPEPPLKHDQGRARGDGTGETSGSPPPTSSEPHPPPGPSHPLTPGDPSASHSALRRSPSPGWHFPSFHPFSHSVHSHAHAGGASAGAAVSLSPALSHTMSEPEAAPLIRPRTHHGLGLGFSFGSRALRRHGSDPTRESAPLREPCSLQNTTVPEPAPTGSNQGLHPTHTIRMIPQMDVQHKTPNYFEPVERCLEQDGEALLVGRFTDHSPWPPQDNPEQSSNPARAGRALSPSSGQGACSPPPANDSQRNPGVTSPRKNRLKGGAIPNINGGPDHVEFNKVAFLAKVISRNHCEIWCTSDESSSAPLARTTSVPLPATLPRTPTEHLPPDDSAAVLGAPIGPRPSTCTKPAVKWWIRDTGSSTGTFLNRIRLSPSGVKSKPTQIKEGDLVQLGVDCAFGSDQLYQAIRMRIELHAPPDPTKTTWFSHMQQQLASLRGDPLPSTEEKPETPDAIKASTPECCICLSGTTAAQALFVASCRHVFHYKCLRPVLSRTYPMLECPYCRTTTNVEEEEDVAYEPPEAAPDPSTPPTTRALNLLPDCSSITPVPPATQLGQLPPLAHLSLDHGPNHDAGNGSTTEESPDTPHLLFSASTPSTGHQADQGILTPCVSRAEAPPTDAGPEGNLC